jgi:hypothetical protein
MTSKVGYTYLGFWFPSLVYFAQTKPHVIVDLMVWPWVNTQSNTWGVTLRASVKIPERGIELCLAGDAESRSPDFTRPPASVDRAPRWLILRFLTWVDPLAPCEAPRALGLTYVVVDRPEHPPPMSSPACVRGPADSGHHHRRVVPCCDRKDLPKPTPPFAWPPSPPISRATLITFAGTVQKGGGTSGKKE